jgi:hypothetical protein
MAYVDKELVKKAIKFYRDGLPIEVIENLTRIPKPRLESILGEVELTKDELLARKESLEIFSQSIQEKVIERRTRRTEVESEILGSIESNFSTFMKQSFERLCRASGTLPLDSFKDVASLVGAMGKASEIWERFNDAVAKRDLKAMQDIMATMELEVTNITVQTAVDSEGRIKLDADGKRVVTEEAQARKITLKPL